MADFVVGSKHKGTAVDSLIEAIREVPADDGILYVGFPLVASEGGTSTIDALFTSSAFGVVIFDLLDAAPDANSWGDIEDNQSRLAAGLMSRLLLHRELRHGRELAFDVQVITYSPMPVTVPAGHEIQLATPADLHARLSELPSLGPEILIHLNAALQSVSTIKPRKKRAAVKIATSRGAALKEIERNIANLDRWQRQAAIETPEAPQRIRGIAGSGKTIVLALKAAYLHAQHPEWTIAITFQTRSLYQQFRDLARRFFFDQQHDEPDWKKLRILHAWGSSKQPGIYSEIAAAGNAPPMNFIDAKARFGAEGSFAGACEELLKTIEAHGVSPIFDSVLIDEAQDLPVSFFKIVYHATKPPKRVVWAYDELQNLGAYSMAPPEELFGTDAESRPLVELRNVSGAPHQDIILPVCYRNTPWNLATAHALGFGVYRQEGLCQFFDDAGLWRDIGYEVVTGELSPGREVALARRADCSPPFFKDLLTAEDAVECRSFASRGEELKWIVESLKKNLTEDELEPDDILVIFPNPVSVPIDAAPLLAALTNEGIGAHIVGVTSSRDEVFQANSIAVSGIYRAKGNEAPMVYVANSDYCVSLGAAIKKRNTLFTAMTRSRTWIRLSGSGAAMQKLDGEMKSVRDHGFRLDFSVPTPEELGTMRKIHRDMTRDQKRVVKETEEVLGDFFARVEAGEMSFDDLEPDIRKKIKIAAGLPPDQE